MENEIKMSIRYNGQEFNFVAQSPIELASKLFEMFQPANIHASQSDFYIEPSFAFRKTEWHPAIAVLGDVRVPFFHQRR